MHNPPIVPNPVPPSHPGLRIGAVLGGGLLLLLVVVAVIRPDMMPGMAMIQRLIVGFGL